MHASTDPDHHGSADSSPPAQVTALAWQRVVRDTRRRYAAILAAVPQAEPERGPGRLRLVTGGEL